MGYYIDKKEMILIQEKHNNKGNLTEPIIYFVDNMKNINDYKEFWALEEANKYALNLNIEDNI